MVHKGYICQRFITIFYYQFVNRSNSNLPYKNRTNWGKFVFIT